MSRNLIDFIEEYFNSEGLPTLIHPSRRKMVFQSPNTLLLWIGGLLGITLLMAWRNGRIWSSVVFFFITLLVLFTIITLITLVYQKKNKKSSYTLESLIIFAIFPICLLANIFIFTMGWKVFHETWTSIILFVTLFGVVILEALTHFLTIGFKSLKTFFIVIGKSLSALLVVAPLLFLVIIMSVFSQDIWLILGKTSMNYWYGILILAIPPLLVSYLKIRDVVADLIEKHRTELDNSISFESIPFFSKIIETGLISPQELIKVQDDLSWRIHEKTLERYESTMKKGVIIRVIINIEAITLFLILIFFTYFFALFWVVIPPALVSEWTGTSLDVNVYRIIILGKDFFFPSTLLITAKISFFLSIVISVIARISIVIDDNFKEKTLSWLSEKYREWIVACLTYDCVLYPNFQYWKHLVKNVKVVNVHIVFRPNLSQEKVKEACHHFLEQENIRTNLQIVTAFEKEDGRKDYNFGKPGKRWQLLINRKNQVEQFSDFTMEPGEEYLYSHGLGYECLENGEPIPDDWFGKDEVSVEIAKEIWNSDKGHNLIWHPTVNRVKDLYFVEIYLTKRCESSKDYIHFSKNMMVLVTSKVKDFMTITLMLRFRDSLDNIASTEYFKPTDLITYKDEHLKKPKNIKYDVWIKS